MIIFDLDGTLADCEHRRHLINPDEYRDLCEYSNYKMIDGQPVIDLDGKASWRYKNTGEPFKSGWPAFYAACDKDTPIEPVVEILDGVYQNVIRFFDDVQIWSARCESVKDKTLEWLKENILWDDLGDKITIKMRPVGDNTPDDQLKERWLDEEISQGKKIDFVVDDRPKVVRMWRRRGIFVFDVNQTGKEF